MDNSQKKVLVRVEQAKELIASGMPAYLACERAKIAPVTFKKYTAKKKNPTKKSAVFIVPEETPSPSKTFMLVGALDDLAKVMRGLL